MANTVATRTASQLSIAILSHRGAWLTSMKERTTIRHLTYIIASTSAVTPVLGCMVSVKWAGASHQDPTVMRTRTAHAHSSLRSVVVPPLVVVVMSPHHVQQREN